MAELREARGPLRIHRIDRRPTATLEGSVDPAAANASAIVAAASRDAHPALVAAHPGLSIGAEGASAQGARTRNSMLRGLPIGLAAVYAPLAFQFRSWLAPVAVMAVIPFAVIGAMVGHLAIGAPFSLPSMLGLASLAGVVVNGSILLAAEMRRALAAGASVEDAAASAAARRFRAILLTTVTALSLIFSAVVCAGMKSRRASASVW